MVERLVVRGVEILAPTDEGWVFRGSELQFILNAVKGSDKKTTSSSGVSTPEASLLSLVADCERTIKARWKGGVSTPPYPSRFLQGF